MDFDFQDPGAFKLLAFVAVLAIVATIGILARRRALARFASHPMLIRLAPHASILRPAIRAGLATFSPRLDRFGNSARGVSVFEELSREFDMHLFDPDRLWRTSE